MKEFWIAQGSHADIVCYSEKQAKELEWSKPCIHVKEVNPSAELEIRELREKLNIAVEALEFYAEGAGVECVDEGRNYNQHYVAYENDYSKEGKMDATIGTKARETLSKIKGY